MPNRAHRRSATFSNGCFDSIPSLTDIASLFSALDQVWNRKTAATAEIDADKNPHTRDECRSQNTIHFVCCLSKSHEAKNYRFLRILGIRQARAYKCAHPSAPSLAIRQPAIVRNPAGRRLALSPAERPFLPRGGCYQFILL